MNNNQLEEKALEALASMFYNAGYRKGIKVGMTGSLLGVVAGTAVMVVLWMKEEGYFKKTENKE